MIRNAAEKSYKFRIIREKFFNIKQIICQALHLLTDILFPMA